MTAVHGGSRYDGFSQFGVAEAVTPGSPV